MAVAKAQGIALDYDERWAAITGLLEKAVGGKASMLQDVEAKRQTEIEVINGAIVDAGRARRRADAAQRDDGLDDPGAAERHYLAGEGLSMTATRDGAAARDREACRSSFPACGRSTTCRMSVEAGEIRALLGENGAGKSTLGKIVAGVYARDQGAVLARRRRARRRSTRRRAGDLGIGIVHQEGSLVPQLSVAENIFAGRQPTQLARPGRRARACATRAEALIAAARRRASIRR